MTNPRQVLIVSDDAGQRGLFRAWLEEAGLGVSVAHDYDDAYGQALTGSFDLIIVDLANGADGIDLIKKVRDRPELISTLVLAIAAWGSGLGTLALGQNVDAYEPAPIDAARLVALVRRLLGNALAVAK